MDFEKGLFMVDGQHIGSYPELLQLASSEKYRNREFIEIILLPPVMGG